MPTALQFNQYQGFLANANIRNTSLPDRPAICTFRNAYSSFFWPLFNVTIGVFYHPWSGLGNTMLWLFVLPTWTDELNGFEFIQIKGKWWIHRIGFAVQNALIWRSRNGGTPEDPTRRIQPSSARYHPWITFMVTWDRGWRGAPTKHGLFAQVQGLHIARVNPTRKSLHRQTRSAHLDWIPRGFRGRAGRRRVRSWRTRGSTPFTHDQRLERRLWDPRDDYCAWLRRGLRNVKPEGEHDEGGLCLCCPLEGVSYQEEMV